MLDLPGKPYVGTWSGSWFNTTLGSTGPASIAVSVNQAGTEVTFTITLGGYVFGTGSPPPETFTAPLGPSGVSFSGTSSTFGQLVATIDQLGNLSGSGTNIQSPNVSAISFDGAWTSAGLNLNYTVALRPSGTAVGTVNLTKLPRLTLTIATDTPGKGGGSVDGNGGVACGNGTCVTDLPQGTTVTLAQHPDANSTWATWSVPACGSNQSCQVVMDGDKQVTATFHYSAMAKVDSSGIGYEGLTLAYGHAAATDTILARAVLFQEDFSPAARKTITLKGGLNAYYAQQDAYTQLQGTLTQGEGLLIVDRLLIK